MQKKAVGLSPEASMHVSRVGAAVVTSWTSSKAIDDGLKASSAVYSCVTMIAKSFAQIPWYAARNKPNSEGVEILEDHPLTELFRKPHPFMSRSALMERFCMHILLAGNGIFYMAFADGLPYYLWPLDPDLISPVPDPNGYLRFYEASQAFKYKSGIEKIPIEKIIHHQLTNPRNPYWGLSPLEANAVVVDTENDAINWNRNSLKNRAMPSGVMAVNDEHLIDDQYDDMAAKMKKHFEGPENAYKPFLLGADAKWFPITMNALEMDFLGGREFTRSEICGIFGVDPALIGSEKASTYANKREARKAMWMQTLIPFANAVCQTFDMQLAPHYGEDIVTTYRINHIRAVADYIMDSVEAMQKMWGMGVPFNTVKQVFNMPMADIEGGDVPYIPTSMMPADDMKLDV